MNPILWAVFLLSATSYLASCVLFIAQARQRPATHVRAVWPPRLLVIGASLHLLCLVLFSIMERRCPVYSLHLGLGLISLVGVAAYLVLSRHRRLDAVGGVVAALAALFLVTAQALTARPGSVGDRWLMAIHITSNFLSGGILLVAGAASVFYVWNERRLRARRALGQGPKLPPLESLDSIVHRLLWIGVPLLTLGLVTGRIAIHHADVITAADRVRAVLSEASWLLLLAVLLLRQFAGWRGRRPAYATLLGVLGILLVIVLYVARAMFGFAA
jgi:ABC-type uncharacterized transport system permease subunit